VPGLTRMSKNVEVIKKGNRPTLTGQEITAFQLQRAHVETRHAFKTIEMYAANVEDAGFKDFMRKLWLEAAKVVLA